MAVKLVLVFMGYIRLSGYCNSLTPPPTRVWDCNYMWSSHFKKGILVLPFSLEKSCCISTKGKGGTGYLRMWLKDWYQNKHKLLSAKDIPILLHTDIRTSTNFIHAKDIPILLHTELRLKFSLASSQPTISRLRLKDYQLWYSWPTTKFIHTPPQTPCIHFQHMRLH